VGGGFAGGAGEATDGSSSSISIFVPPLFTTTPPLGSEMKIPKMSRFSATSSFRMGTLTVRQLSSPSAQSSCPDTG
jgi:hypothetical protein